MKDETPTPLEGELNFLRDALADNGPVEPNLWAIRQKIATKRRRNLLVRSAAGVAAAIALLAAGYLLGPRGPQPTAIMITSTGDAEYLQAAVAQLSYETELLRARTLPKEKGQDPQELQYPDTAAILLASARYWETTGADQELSNARYQEILNHFPESSAAAAAIRSRSSAGSANGL
jgi:hypothetical protein